MRAALNVLLLLGVVSAFFPCAAPISGIAVSQPDAAVILRGMRNALGGEAALDAVRSLSMTATGRMEIKGMSMGIADEYALLFPDHYLRTRRLIVSRSADGAIFEGFRGDQLIRVIGRRKTPPPGVPNGDPLAFAKFRHDAARLVLALTGRTLPNYPLTLAAAGTEEAGGSTYDIIEARGPEGVIMRLYVDAKTHLPAMVASSGLEKTPFTRWLLSEFKKADGLNWPWEIEEQVDGGLVETVTVKSWKVNPPLDPRSFDPIRRSDEPIR
jgi:hypothetical protein